ncbi:D-glycero-beta-D-manno-heptose-7-phosphate kinase [bacterium]|nr:D-glycero-beta-D-manno-heptose-7-phosphate kinase [bacterium]
MIGIKKHRLTQLFKAFSHKKLVVIGDFMLDRYITGKVSRISPEAPVPVVQVESEYVRLGGAANVVLNVASLGASVFPIGIIGSDPNGQELKKLLRQNNFTLDGIFTDSSRPTTVKTRVIADCQHVVRADFEKIHPVSKELQTQVVTILNEMKNHIDGIILEDYNKGLLVPSLIKRIVSFANQRDIMTFVDPKYDHFFDFKEVTLFKPNRSEVSNQLHMRVCTKEELIHASEQLFSRLYCNALLITLGKDGMMLFEKDKQPKHVHTKAVNVHDVSGAGDTVIATMAVAMTAGSTLPEAATLANHAAGLVCGEVGVVSIDQKQLYQAMLADRKSKS